MLILQFIKGAWKYGELKAVETLGEGNDRIQIRPMGDGFVFHNKDKESEEEFRRKRHWLRKPGRWSKKKS